jgi:hypothetical protein
MIEAGADAVGGASDAVAEAPSKAGSKFGLTGSQKAGALSAGIASPRTHHPYVVGLLLIAGGSCMLIGSITGALPSMLAALFCPTALQDANANPVSTGDKIGNFIVGTGPGTLYARGRSALGLG